MEYAAFPMPETCRTTRTTGRSRRTSTTTSTTSACATGSRSAPRCQGAPRRRGRRAGSVHARRRRAGRATTTRVRRRQRPPLGPALAGAGVPGRGRRSPASSCTRTTTGTPGRLAASGCWCSASATPPGHRGRVVAVAAATYLAMRRGAHILPKYLFGRADRPPHQLAAGARAAADPAAGDGGVLRPRRAQVTDYGLPEARPRGARRAPDGHRRPAQPARPRRHHAEAEHRALRRARRCASPTARGRGRRRRLLHRLQGHLPVPRRGLVAAPDNHVDALPPGRSTPSTAACTSSA